MTPPELRALLARIKVEIAAARQRGTLEHNLYREAAKALNKDNPRLAGFSGPHWKGADIERILARQNADATGTAASPTHPLAHGGGAAPRPQRTAQTSTALSADLPPVGRGLSPAFLADLKTGKLQPLLDRVHRDGTLDLEIRRNYINIYYRGGCVLKLEEAQWGYLGGFDRKYFPSGLPPGIDTAPELRVRDDATHWLKSLPALKDAMDLLVKVERDVQQAIVRTNNLSAVSLSTDYYFCDLEYDAGDAGRFDLVGVHWPSDGSIRKQDTQRRLVIAELKQGDGAMGGDSGLGDHVRKINQHFADPAALSNFKAEMVQVFNQKRDLGLLDPGRRLVSFSNEKPILLLLIANHDPAKTAFSNALSQLPPSPHLEIKFAASCFIGYGIYDQAVFTLGEARERFGDVIHDG